MNILGICGTHKRKGDWSASEWLLSIALEAAREEGANTDSIRLIDYNVTPCTACNECRIGHKCRLLESPDDQAKIIFDKISWADGLIFSSPTYAYQQPAVVYNLIQRTIPLHEWERSPFLGTKITAYKENPFHGKAVGNLAVSAALGQEGTLFDLFHYLKTMGATSVACAGVSLLDPEMKNLFKDAEEVDPRMKELLALPSRPITEDQQAVALARAVGQKVVVALRSPIFQAMKGLFKY